MTFYLSSLTFNHDTTSITNSAMNIRINRDYEILIPEYNHYFGIFGFTSKSAYAIEETTKQLVTVKTQFRRTGSSTPSPTIATTYEIRASRGGILGSIDTLQVSFPANVVEVELDVPIANRDFSKVGKYYCTWNWEYRLLGFDEWNSMPSTSHNIYLVLRNPQSPWSQDFGSSYNPWTDLLDKSCVIASGTKEDHFVTMALTKSINSNYNLKYDIMFGAPRYEFVYSGYQFNLTNWIDYVLEGNAPYSPRFCPGTSDEYTNYLIVNCYDNASSLSIMSKILGVDITYQWHQPFGYLEYVVPIGRSRSNNPFYGCGGSSNAALGEDDSRSAFGNHTYAKRGNGRNYDSTMRQYVPCGTRITLLLLLAIIMLFSFGRGDRDWSLRNRINGWLINLTQENYETYTNDTSAAFESAMATGVPVPEILNFD